MALFTDGGVSSIEDLHGLDTQLLDVASVEGIDVSRKLGLAQEELEIELEAVLSRMSTQPYDPVLQSVKTWIGRVVVSAPLKLWHSYRALELVYRDAYYSQLNDRYKARRDEYHELSRWAYGKLLQSGVGMVGNAVPQALAPELQAAAGGLADGTYYVGVSWTNAGGGEGACSRAASITTVGSTFTVTPGAAPGNAAGWNVYVGVSPAALARQNGAVLGMGTMWTQPGVVANGAAAGTGQAVDYVQPVERLIDRG
ncbi:MAG: hypothetical protein KGN36_11385 [Acidobacteriota bacterium]|nr:hypothetical protein [Acidobacteriota bacterium]